MSARFAEFNALAQVAQDNQEFAKVKLTMTVLAVGSEKSFGATQAVIMLNVVTNVQGRRGCGAGHCSSMRGGERWSGGVRTGLGAQMNFFTSCRQPIFSL